MTEEEKMVWFLTATADAARDAREAFKDATSNGAASHQHWLLYRPGGQEFAIVPEGEPTPDGFLHAADVSIPMRLRGLTELTAWIRARTQALPHYPRSNRR